MNKEQEAAIRSWISGSNVKVTAVPGAGKSRVLLEACKSLRGGKALLLSYNRELCDATKVRIDALGISDSISCHTFHGLATYCLMPAQDDAALFDAIEMAERGDLPIKNKLVVSAILLDEAQDFRPSFVRLLNLVVDSPLDVQYMVVGDPNQMLYTYDREDPANLTYITTPEAHFQSSRGWESFEFSQTHRLTPPMAKVISEMFDRTVTCAACNISTSSPPLPVKVISADLWRSGPMIVELIRNERVEDVVILVPSKTNNGPLRATLNFLSRAGYRIYLHGFDGHDARVRKGKLCVGTWHSSKGTEKKLAIVFGLSNASATNPSYVAMSRAWYRLVIVQDERNPHIGLQTILADSIARGDVDACSKTVALMRSPPIVPLRSIFDIGSAKTYSLDTLRVNGTARWMRAYMKVEKLPMTDCDMRTVEDEEGDVMTCSDLYEDVSVIYTLACCMAVEYKRTGKVRLLDDIISPLRLTKHRQDVAIASGHHSRFVSPNIAPASLLCAEMYNILDGYRDMMEVPPIYWCKMASFARCWNDYHHTGRQLQPFEWFDEDKFQQGCSIMQDNIAGGGAVHDVRITKTIDAFPDTILHARVQSTGTDGIYLYFWGAEITHAHQITGTIRAALHEHTPVAHIVNLRTGERQRLSVTEPNALLTRLLTSSDH